MYVFVQIEMTAVSIRGPFNNYGVKMEGGGWVKKCQNHVHVFVE